MEDEVIEVERRVNWFADLDNYVFLLVAGAIATVLLGFALYGCLLLVMVALVVGLRARWQYAVTFLLLIGVMVALVIRVEAIYNSAKNNAISATLKAPGMVVAIPARYFGEGAIVANGQVHSFTGMLANGEVIAIGVDGAGTIKAQDLDRGELTTESNVGNALLSLPKKARR